MTDPTRVRRHAERVRELVASVVRTQIKDPRLGMITITDARLTGDLRDATVFYTVLGDAAAKAGTAAALDSANGLLRSTVGRALGLRHSPTLTFVLDDVLDRANHIDDLLAEARRADAEVQRLAVRAEYAGDPQPYRLADEDGEDDDEDDGDAPETMTETRGGGGPAGDAGRVVPAARSRAEGLDPATVARTGPDGHGTTAVEDRQ